MIGSAEPFIAIAIIISACVSLIGTSARKRAVQEGRARAAEICELTGIFDPRVLQDVFGPPTMNGVYQVSMEQIKKARMPLGRLISDDRFDLGDPGQVILDPVDEPLPSIGGDPLVALQVFFT